MKCDCKHGLKYHGNYVGCLYFDENTGYCSCRNKKSSLTKRKG